MKSSHRKIIIGSLTACLLAFGGNAMADATTPSVLPGKCQNMMSLAEILATNGGPGAAWDAIIAALSGTDCSAQQ